MDTLERRKICSQALLMEMVLWKEHGSQCQGGIPCYAASASSKRLPVRELGLTVVWTFPRSYGLHLWFGCTAKTTWEFSPTFGHLAGNSGQKPLQESWTWTSLSCVGWCLWWECKWCSFPLLSHLVLSRLQHTGGCSGRVCWEIFWKPGKTEDSALSPQKPMFFCDWAFWMHSPHF